MSSRIPKVLSKKTYVGATPFSPLSTPVYIGRGSKWGNPYRIGQSYHINGVTLTNISRDDAIRLYVYWFPTHLLASLSELVGKDLICYCAPLPCHGDWLLEQANKWSQR